MRVIVRKERPHPGAPLRFTDVDGHRFTALGTDAKRGQRSQPLKPRAKAGSLTRCSARRPQRMPNMSVTVTVVRIT